MPKCPTIIFISQSFDLITPLALDAFKISIRTRLLFTVKTKREPKACGQVNFELPWTWPRQWTLDLNDFPQTWNGKEKHVNATRTYDHNQHRASRSDTKQKQHKKHSQDDVNWLLKSFLTQLASCAGLEEFCTYIPQLHITFSSVMNERHRCASVLLAVGEKGILISRHHW